MQNFAPWGFSAEQFWQRIGPVPALSNGPSCITRHREGAAASRWRKAPIEALAPAHFGVVADDEDGADSRAPHFLNRRLMRMFSDAINATTATQTFRPS
jgi:hypothetical protein